MNKNCGVLRFQLLHLPAGFGSHAAAAAAKSLLSCPTLRDPIDGSPPGSAIPGILQARTLEWVAISLSKSYLLTSINEEIEAQRD